MSRSLKIFKGAIVAIIALLIGYLTIDNVMFDPSQGIVTRGELELSWSAPTEKLDSSPLANLAGYEIHCWDGENQEIKTVVIDDPAVTSYEIDRLWPGTYRCAVSAIANDGGQSALSNVVTKVVH